MSDDTTDDADNTDELTGEELLSRERDLREQRKEFVLEYPDGATATFEYKMLDEETLDQIEDKCTSVRPSRGGEHDVDVDRSTFRTELIMEATTAAPDGFKLTRRNVEELSRDTREAYADAIENFSQMGDTTRQKFR